MELKFIAVFSVCYGMKIDTNYSPIGISSSYVSVNVGDNACLDVVFGNHHYLKESSLI